MMISTLQGLYVPGCRTHETAWVDLAEGLTHSTERAAKDAGPLWSPTIWRDPENRYAQAGPGVEIPKRTAACVVAVTCGVLDFDGASAADLELAIATVQRLGLAAVIHTTWSHMQPGKGARVRLVVPWETPVAAIQWPEVWPRLASLFPGTDRACKDLSRGYYPPAHPPGATPGAWLFEGRPLRIHDLPATPSAAGAGSPSTVLSPAYLSRVAGGLKRSLDPRAQALAEPILLLSQGAAYASAGERHEVTRAITWHLAQRIPGLDPAQAAEVFGASLSHPSMQGFHVEDVRKLFEGALRRVHEKAAEQTEAVARELTDSCRYAWAGIDDGRETPYEPAELEGLAAGHVTGSPGVCPVERLSRAWILCDQRGASYVLGPAGYVRFGGLQAHLGARDLLAPAATAGVERHTLTREGKRGLRPWPEITAEHGSSVAEIAYTYQTPGSVGHRGGVFHLADRRLESACGILRPLEPHFDPRIHEWLEALADTTRQFDALCLWLSFAVDVALPCSALFLVGSGGTGKSLLHDGIGYMWQEPPCSAEVVFGKFNDELLRSPYVVAEESLPTGGGTGKGFNMEAFRSFVSARGRSVEAKGLATVSLTGSVRFVASLQRLELLELKGDLTAADFTAISERITMIHVGARAKVLLQGTRVETLRAWAQGGIARHALALRERRLEREAATGQSMAQGRFLVALDSAADQRALAARSGISDVLVEWLGRALVGQPEAEPGLQVVRCPESSNGLAVAANAAFVWARWANASKDPTPRTGRISRGLAALSVGTMRPGGRGTSRPRMQLIDGALVARWIEDAGIAEDGTAALEALAVDMIE